MNKTLSAFSSFFILAILISSAPKVSASTSNGTIDSSFKVTKICKDPTCSVFGSVNWKPTLNAQTPGALPVTITDTGITGHLWGDEIGWIDLAPTSAGVYVDPTTGALSGKAFSQGGSWINFNPTGAGVFLIDTGTGSELSGWAWVNGYHGGWMKFDCTANATCIKTDWRALSFRDAVPTPEPTPSPIDTNTSNGSHHSKKHHKNGAAPFTVAPSLSQIIDSNNDGFPDNFQPAEDNSNSQNAQDNNSLLSLLTQSATRSCFEDAKAKSHCEILPQSGQSCENVSPCFWCLINKKRQILSFNGSESTYLSRHIIKLGFVPEYLEIRFPASSLSDTYTDIDITSAILILTLPMILLWSLITSPASQAITTAPIRTRKNTNS